MLQFDVISFDAIQDDLTTLSTEAPSSGSCFFGCGGGGRCFFGCSSSSDTTAQK